MNYHKNDENSCTTKIRRSYAMDLFNINLNVVRDFLSRKSLAGFNIFMNNRQASDYWRRFSGRSKTFKMNRRKGL